jgi:soluble lytic murein transglycosylase-like protein
MVITGDPGVDAIIGDIQRRRGGGPQGGPGIPAYNGGPVSTGNQTADATMAQYGQYFPAANPALVSALVGGESGGNAGATSSQGAGGIGQFIPDTARREAGGLAQSIRSGRINLGPEINNMFLNWRDEYRYDASAGTILTIYYIDKLMRKYNGNLVAVFTAYHAGEGIPDKYGGANMTIEDIPAGLADDNMTTRDYVRMQIANYQRRLGQ